MILPFASLETALRALVGQKNQPEVPEPEFTPFDLSHLKEMPKESGRTVVTRPNRVAAYPPPVPFNYPQI